MHPPAYRPKLSMTQSRQFLGKFHHASTASLCCYIITCPSLAAATLQVRLLSSFSVISHSRASESSALLMEISIPSAGAESSTLCNFPSIYSSQALFSHTNKKSVKRVIASSHPDYPFSKMGNTT